MESKIGFSDLTTALKVLVVLCWIMVGLYTMAFLIGIVIGIIESI